MSGMYHRLSQVAKWENGAGSCPAKVVKPLYKVLVIAVEERICKGLAVIIDWQRLGFAVYDTAPHCLAGMAKAEVATPDLVIIDKDAMGGDGIRLFQKLCQRGLQSPIIVLSGDVEGLDNGEPFDLQMTTCLAKPVNETVLTTCIARLFPKPEEQPLSGKRMLLLSYLLRKPQRG